MSSSWFYQGSERPPGVVNIWNSHQNISSEFCNHYYQLWDNNFPMVGRLYSRDIKITFLEHPMNSFDQVIHYVKSQGIWKFEHTSIHGSSQPLDDNTILINLISSVAINNTPYYRKCVESIIIRRNIWDQWYITNSLFRLIPESIF